MEITTCSKCGSLYEAGSDEQANEPQRFCFACRGIPKQPNQDIVLQLNAKQLQVVFAAMLAMVHDIYSLQDQMSEEQWQLADELFIKIETLVNGE